MIARAGLLVATTLVALTLAPPLARADDDPAPAPAPAPAPPEIRAAPEPYLSEPGPTPPPLGRRGFQLALRSGVALPFGGAKDPYPAEATFDEHASSSMRDLVGAQVPLVLDVGGKPNPHLFLGGYLGVAVGWPGGRLADACQELPLDCRSTTVRLGAQIHYVAAPHAWVTPWVGYGIGYAWLSTGDGPREADLRGFEIAHFLVGLDVRLSRRFGIGPFVDYTLGVFTNESLSAGTKNPTPIEGGIADRALHYWFTIGPRLVFFP